MIRKQLSALILILGLVGITACQTPPNFAELRQQALDSELRGYEQKLADEDWAAADAGFQDFLSSNGPNINSIRAKVGRARALIGLGDFHAALNLLQEVFASALITPNLRNQESFLALASFDAGLALEGLGEETKSLAAFQDAEKRMALLPPEIARAELPARLAVASRRVQNGLPSKEYFARAQAGVETLYRGDDEKSRSIRARTYQRMGQMGNLTAMADPDRDLREDIAALQYMQFFSLRAVEENDPKWSPLALKDLQESYQNIWNLVMSKRQKDNDPLVDLTVSMEKLRALQSPNMANDQTKQFFQFLDTLENQAQILLVEAQSLTPLTPEAQRREGLRRAGTIHDEPRFRNEKRSQATKPVEQRILSLPEKKDPSPQLPAADPNLDNASGGH